MSGDRLGWQHDVTIPRYGVLLGVRTTLRFTINHTPSDPIIIDQRGRDQGSGRFFDLTRQIGWYLA